MKSTESHPSHGEVPQARRRLLEFFEYEAAQEPQESSEASHSKRQPWQARKQMGARKYSDWAGLKRRIQGMALPDNMSSKNINIEVVGTGDSPKKAMVSRYLHKHPSNRGSLGGLKNLKQIFGVHDGALEASLLNPASRIFSTNDSLPTSQVNQASKFLKVLDKTIQGLKLNSAPVSAKLTPKKLSLVENPKSFVRETAASFSASRNSISGHPKSCKLLLDFGVAGSEKPNQNKPQTRAQERHTADGRLDFKWKSVKKREPSPELKKLFELLRKDSTETVPQDEDFREAVCKPDDPIHQRDSSQKPKCYLRKQPVVSSNKIAILQRIEEAIKVSKQAEQHSRRVSAELESIKRKISKGTAQRSSHFDSHTAAVHSLDTRLQQMMQRRSAVGQLRASPTILTKSPFLA